MTIFELNAHYPVNGRQVTCKGIVKRSYRDFEKISFSKEELTLSLLGVVGELSLFHSICINCITVSVSTVSHYHCWGIITWWAALCFLILIIRMFRCIRSWRSILTVGVLVTSHTVERAEGRLKIMFLYLTWCEEEVFTSCGLSFCLKLGCLSLFFDSHFWWCYLRFRWEVSVEFIYWYSDMNIK